MDVMTIKYDIIQFKHSLVIIKKKNNSSMSMAAKSQIRWNLLHSRFLANMQPDTMHVHHVLVPRC